ncbi:MAG: TauD/TfdA family dioxygenase, partial [Alphaproteobacteria bacterium]|nr:TauD/TfdA family dioxygenase [Alphaproteobacteria bacterium]
MVDNPWRPSERRREPARLMSPVVDSGCWRAADVAGREDWIYRLDEGEIAEVMDAVTGLEARGLDIKDVTREDFPLPRLSVALADIREELMEGRGFALIRGLPVEGRGAYQNAAAFWGVSTHIGRAFSQNADGHLLGHVRDSGSSLKTAHGRGYRSNEELGFHADGCDITSLFVLKLAKSGGQHRMCSSVALYNEMLARRPDLADALAFSFYRTRRGEVPKGVTGQWFRQPVFSVADGYFAARGASTTIIRAQDVEGVPKLTDTQREAVGYYQALAAELAVDIDFEPGDMEYAQSHVTLHMRTAYEDWPEPKRRRHLLRLWMSTDGARPLVPEVADEIERGILL